MEMCLCDPFLLCTGFGFFFFLGYNPISLSDYELFLSIVVFVVLRYCPSSLFLSLVLLSIS